MNLCCPRTWSCGWAACTACRSCCCNLLSRRAAAAESAAGREARDLRAPCRGVFEHTFSCISNSQVHFDHYHLCIFTPETAVPRCRCRCRSNIHLRQRCSPHWCSSGWLLLRRFCLGRLHYNAASPLRRWASTWALSVWVGRNTLSGYSCDINHRTFPLHLPKHHRGQSSRMLSVQALTFLSFVFCLPTSLHAFSPLPFLLPCIL